MISLTTKTKKVLALWMSTNIVSTFVLHPLITCLSAWNEIHDVFGDGCEYDWVLEGDDKAEYEEQLKPKMKYQDVCSIIYPTWARVDTYHCFSGL